MSLSATSSLENQLKTHYSSIFLHWFEPCIRFLTKEMAKMQILSRKQRKPHWNRHINRKVIFGLLCAALTYDVMINATNRREPSNCSIKSFLYRTTFGNDHLQLAENALKFASSKWKCDGPSPWKTVNMRRKKMKKIALFSILAIKKVIRRWFQKQENRLIFQIRSGDREMLPKSGESRFMGESWQVWVGWFSELKWSR